MRVLAVFFHRNLEHLAGAGAVDVPAVVKHFRPPFLPREMGQDSGLNGRKVADDKLISGARDKRGADQFGQHSGDGIIQHIQHFIIAAFHQFPRLLQILHMVLGQVL